MNVKEDKGETTESLTEKTLDILSSKKINISRSEVIAIHRIPGRPNTPKPVIIRLLTNDA
jgi:hypothetical protein